MLGTVLLRKNRGLGCNSEWCYNGANISAQGAAFANGKFMVSFGAGGVFPVAVSTPATLSLPNAWRLLDVSRSPNSQINGVAFGAGLWVAVGSDGRIYTALDSDLDTWTFRVDVGGATALNDVYFANGLFITFGSGGFVATSPDGITWTTRVSGTANALNNGAFGAGQHVLVGASGTIISSPDGITWTTRVSGVATALNDITFAAGQFVIAGSVSAGAGVVLTSPDGITWTSRVSGTAFNLFSIAHVAALGLYVIGGGGVVRTSPDGITWSAGAVPTTFTTDTSLAVAVTDGTTLIMMNNGGQIFYTTDVVTWFAHGSGSSNSHSAITKGFGLYVVGAVNFDAILTSPDLKTFTRRFTLATGPEDGAFSGAEIVLTGVSGRVFRSTDGVTWASFNIGVADTQHGCIFAGGQFVSVGDNGTILTSPTGASGTWTARVSGTAASLRDIAHNGSLYVVTTATAGTVLTSPDGITWTLTPLGFAHATGQIAFGGGRFVALSTTLTRQAAVSSDGLTWALVTLDPVNGYNVIAYGAGKFLAQGGFFYAESFDGSVWTAGCVASSMQTSAGGVRHMMYDAAANLFATVGGQEIMTAKPV